MAMTRALTLPVLALALAAAGPSLRADVVVVDPQGGPGAALLQSALDAAQPGDILLLRAGDYSAASRFTLAGKGVCLVADPRDDVVLPGLYANGVPQGQLLLLRGLGLVSPASLDGGSQLIGNGVAWIEDCRGTGFPAWADEAGTVWWATAGLYVQSFATAVIARSSFQGGRGLDATTLPGGGFAGATFGSHGLIVNGAQSCAITDVVATGGRGGDGPPDPFGAWGGPGLGLSSSPQSFVMGGLFTGGDEGEGNTADVMSGSGAKLGFAILAARGASFVPGAVNGVGTVAPPIDLSIGILHEYPAAPRLLAIDSPVREFDSAGVHVKAQPGDLAWLFLTLAPGGLWAPAKQGVWTLSAAQPVVPVLLGPTDPSGLLDLDVTLPALPPGTDGLVVFAQLAVNSGGNVLLGSSSAIVWISAAY